MRTANAIIGVERLYDTMARKNSLRPTFQGKAVGLQVRRNAFLFRATTKWENCENFVILERLLFCVFAGFPLTQHKWEHIMKMRLGTPGRLSSGNRKVTPRLHVRQDWSQTGFFTLATEIRYDRQATRRWEVQKNRQSDRSVVDFSKAKNQGLVRCPCQWPLTERTCR